MADAMYAPVCSRFATYDVQLDTRCSAYKRSIMEWPAMAQWTADARAEVEEMEELDVEF
jgi:glutathione S-transferase